MKKYNKEKIAEKQRWKLNKKKKMEKEWFEYEKKVRGTLVEFKSSGRFEKVVLI